MYIAGNSEDKALTPAELQQRQEDRLFLEFRRKVRD